MTGGGSRSLVVLAAVAVLAGPATAYSQLLPHEVVRQRSQDVDHLFNWYYASIYGTGIYKIGEESVAALRLPFAYTFRKATKEQWGLRLNLPVTAAFAEFDLRDFDLGRVSTVGMSIVPGLEVEIPLGPSWTVKPFASAGAGREFQRDSNALIYSVGATAVYQRPLGGTLTALGGKLVYAGYQSGGEESDLAALSLGGDLGFPLNVELSGRQVVLGVQLIGIVYFNNLDFLMPRTGREEVSHEGEVALTLGVRRAVEVLSVGFDRVGIGYRRGSNGLRGVRLVGSFPF